MTYTPSRTTVVPASGANRGISVQLCSTALTICGHRRIRAWCTTPTGSRARNMRFLRAGLVFGCVWAWMAVILGASQASSLLGTNLIVNGGADFGLGATNDRMVVPPLFWQVTGNLTAVRYGTPNFPSERTGNFLAGGPNSGTSSATQLINVTSIANLIDDEFNRVVFGFDGCFGGSGSQKDCATAVISFLSADKHFREMYNCAPSHKKYLPGETTRPRCTAPSTAATGFEPSSLRRAASSG